jgi:putative glycosyltransferase (TIGR04372 family)
LIVRDPAYKNTVASFRDWSYHNYRDSKIAAFEKAAVALAEAGYWIFRMGKYVQDPFQARHYRIIDYASTPFRCDFLDIWLVANCHYAITTGTGLDEVCTVNRRSYLHVNQLPVGGIRSFNSSIVQFKNLKWKSTGKYIGLREQIEIGVIYALRTHEYNDLGIEIVDNTPDEILEAVFEFDAWKRGVWNCNSEDIELQKEFWQIMKEWNMYSNYHGKIQARVSNSFLRKNHTWFLS